MYSCLINTNDKHIDDEIGLLCIQFDNIKTVRFQITDSIDINEYLLNCLIIIVTEINPEALKILKQINYQVPDIPIVFYNHSLIVSNLAQIGDTSILNIIVGDSRKEVLSNLIQASKNKHWRKIPLEQFSIDVKNLSPRLKKALAYIEYTDIKKCNINTIASIIQISPGYFSQKFKRETGQSFRAFMQKLLYYYEDLILSRANISTKYISKFLGYSELSSFSRSFKNRKGISPKEYKKQVQAI
jgi:YesN/AraC family two-component response regulator